jgi:glycosyltransferase involved in cell wall biosynthesis
MKIAFVSLMRGANWGGSEELWSKTALRALSEGHKVETLTYGWDPLSPRLLKLQEAGVSTKFYYGESTALLDRIAVKLRVKKRKIEMLPSVEADVCVISNGSIWDFIRLRPVTDHILATGKPYIILAHNTLDYGDILDEQQREYAIRVLEKAARVLFVSERNWRGAERQLAHPIRGAQVVANPVNIRKAFIKPFPTSERLLMASVGSLDCSFKGQDLMLEALNGAVWKERDFLLRIYGTGPHTQYLHHLIASYGLQGKVTLEGHVSDVDGIWEASQVLVLSSVTEGVPMVVVEAMLSGRAVVGTDVGAVDLYVKEGETGFLVPVAKAKYLAEGLEKLWNSRARLKEMGEHAFKHAIAITDATPEENFLNIIKASQ